MKQELLLTVDNAATDDATEDSFLPLAAKTAMEATVKMEPKKWRLLLALRICSKMREKRHGYSSLL